MISEFFEATFIFSGKIVMLCIDIGMKENFERSFFQEMDAPQKGLALERPSWGCNGNTIAFFQKSRFQSGDDVDINFSP